MIDIPKERTHCRLTANLPALSTAPQRPVSSLEDERIHFRLTYSGEELDGIFTFRIQLLKTHWDKLVPKERVLLRSDYLSSLEENPPAGLSFGYLLLCRQGRPAGVAYFQYFDFQLNRHVNSQEEVADHNATWEKVGRRLLGRRRIPVLVCGNLLLTGEYGWYFHREAVYLEDVLPAALEKVATFFDRPGQCPRVLMLKDLPAGQQDSHSGFAPSTFHAFQFQPEMNLPLSPHWNTFEDYLAAMVSKYRVRARRTAKKGKALRRRLLGLQEIYERKKEIHHLYRAIAEKAEVNLFHLPADYFPALAGRLGKDFQLHGYFHENTLTGFYTTIRHGDRLVAHFLGFRETDNHRFQLYLNMLSDIARQGIEEGCQEISFARTALEIKSSVGAEARPLQVWMKHRKDCFNCFLPHLVDWFAPEEEWQPRRPFGGD